MASESPATSAPGSATGAHPTRPWIAHLWSALRVHPEYLFVPTVSLLFVVNLSPIGFGPAWLARFLAYLSDPRQGLIFPFTWSAAWVSFAVATAEGSRRTRLGLFRTVLVAASVPFGATGLFELVYQFVGAQVQPWGFHMSLFMWVSLALWTSVGLTGVPYWRLTWDYVLLASGFLGGFVLWTVIGFPQITWGTPSQEPWAYAFNVPLKGAAFGLFLLPTLRGWRSARPAPVRT